MQWLTDLYLREGPGIPKDLPKKRGLVLFGQIAGREAVELVKLNLIVVLFSLPLVTVFAAQAAGLRIAQAMVRDENVYLRGDFLRAFRELFVLSTLVGAVAALALAFCAYAAFVYMQAATANLAFAAPLALAGITFGFLSVVSMHLFGEVAAGKDVRTGLRRALLATLALPHQGAAALAFVASLWLAHVLFYPASIFMPVAVNFSLGLLACAFAQSAAAERLTEPELADRQSV